MWPIASDYKEAQTHDSSFLFGVFGLIQRIIELTSLDVLAL